MSQQGKTITANQKGSPEAAPLLRAIGLSKSFKMGDTIINVLKKVDISLAAGEFVAVEGRSGSGKSTMLHLMGALDTPTSGSVAYDGKDLAKLPGDQRCAIRSRHFGFVFQSYFLLPELNVLENCMLSGTIREPAWKFWSGRKALKERAKEVLEMLGMGHRLNHRPNHLSGGERQRVAIGRALMNKPRVLFADEPTGNLDAETGRQIMDVLEGLHRDHGQTIIMVTHDRALAREADRVLILREGRLDRSPAN